MNIIHWLLSLSADMIHRKKLSVQTSDNSQGSIPFRLHRELQAVSCLVSSCDHYDKGQLSAVVSPSSVCQVGPLFHNLKEPVAFDFL